MSADKFVIILKQLQDIRLDYEHRKDTDMIADKDIDNVELLQESVYDLMKSILE